MSVCKVQETEARFYWETNSARAVYPSLKDSELFEKGVAHVRASDPKIGRLVKKHGVVEFKPGGQAFRGLVESILSQQLNGHAAELITSRVNRLFLPGRVTPEKLYKVSPAKLRAAGVSPQKIGYLKDLSGRIVDRRLDLRRLHEKSDGEILRMLDEVRGVGPWTAQMVLMFVLGRADILPVDDFGIQKAVMLLYGLPEMPDRETMERIAEPWHPYSTIACLYLWRHKDGVS